MYAYHFSTFLFFSSLYQSIYLAYSRIAHTAHIFHFVYFVSVARLKKKESKKKTSSIMLNWIERDKKDLSFPFPSIRLNWKIQIRIELGKLSSRNKHLRKLTHSSLIHLRLWTQLNGKRDRSIPKAHHLC